MSLPAAALEAAPPLGPPAAAPLLSTRSIVDYSLPTFGTGFTFVLVNIYLLKYATDVLLIAPATMGLLFGASRLWDALADPAVGFLTDRTRSRFGRRRPWILAAALPLGVTFAMLWAPPVALAGSGLLLWTGCALFVFYTSIAMLDTAHAALGAELTDAYHERTRVFGIRRIVFGLGTLCAVAALAAFGSASDARRVGATVGLLGGVVVTASILWMVLRTRERPEFRDRGAKSPLRAFRDVWRNRHARVLLLVFVIQQLGVTTLMTIMPYLSEYVLLTPAWTFAYIGTLFVSAIIGVPLWIRFKPRGGKKGGLILAMATIGIGIGALWFAGEGDIAIVFAVARRGRARVGRHRRAVPVDPGRRHRLGRAADRRAQGRRLLRGLGLLRQGRGGALLGDRRFRARPPSASCPTRCRRRRPGTACASSPPSAPPSCTPSASCSSSASGSASASTPRSRPPWSPGAGTESTNQLVAPGGSPALDSSTPSPRIAAARSTRMGTRGPRARKRSSRVWPRAKRM